MSIIDRIRHGWNAFMGRDPVPQTSGTYFGDTYRPDRVRLTRGSERSIITSIVNRIAVDVASLSVEHVEQDDEGRYIRTRDSYLNECLTMNANDDQSARMFMQDAVMSLLDEGVIGIVPTLATDNPMSTSSFDIRKMRIGKVVEWFPQHVKLNIYNEETGKKEDRVFPKAMVALPENPFYAIMNEPNSTYQRLLRKLRALDAIDDQSASDKMNLIFQVPYSTSTELQRKRAEGRRTELERQLTSSKYGIAYIDSTEKVIQLNRSIENNLFSQVEYYTNMLFSQLGMPAGVFDGSADEQMMINYHNRTLEPIISAITDAMTWKFLSKTARTQGQRIMFFQDVFKLTPPSQLSEIVDPLSRNEILTPNEIRQILGYKPSSDPTADELINSNMPHEELDPTALPEEAAGVEPTYDESDLAEIDDLDAQLDELEASLQ